jgi:hypothetical protein
MRSITNRTEDVALNVGNLILGVALFASPWFLGMSADASTTWNTWIAGGVIAVVAVMAAVQTYDWEEWVNLFAGLWAAVSPWVFGFVENTPAMWTHVAIGLAVAVLAAGELWRLFGASGARSA